jgi:AAA15 family ATPase/GTPase
MTAILNRFRVRNFRSVTDSGWIDTSNLTALIGTNEAGKTNLLLPLWKLNPANNEPIDPLIDYPRSMYSTFKSSGDETPFIEAEFNLEQDQANSLSKVLKISPKYVDTLLYRRHWNGNYSIFIQSFNSKEFSTSALLQTFQAFISQIEPFGEFEGSEDVKTFFASLVADLNENIENPSKFVADRIEKFGRIEFKAEEVQKLAIESVIKSIREIKDLLDSEGLIEEDEAFEMVKDFLPAFVYYSDYGNLNSEIYLPRVIDDLKRRDLRGIERDKARTLKVLFDFVTLTPKEVLELGQEQGHTGNKTEEVIAEEARRKKEREVLLQSASTKMTKEFKDWWKQGNYRFRFQADGNHFRIWVSDEKRPEEIELESRSRGLQWFFSFFLVFLVESQDQHNNCILLLDEPGVTLHPVAQEDLIKFFKSIAGANQLIYTTHSPFLIDSNELGNVKAVYVDESGHSTVSADLRKGSKVAENSIYPVHAAIGLTISETFLNGCQPVLVEGVSDQIYLHAIKQYLQRKQLVVLNKEIVFIPTGGVKGMKPIINIISSKNSTELPKVVIDSDQAGLTMADSLKKDLYRDQTQRVLGVHEILEMKNSEIEDLIPTDVMTGIVDRQHRVDEGSLEEDLVVGQPFVGQAEAFLSKNSVVPLNGWKVELAREVSKKIQRSNFSVSDNVEKIWIELFQKIS